MQYHTAPASLAGTAPRGALLWLALVAALSLASCVPQPLDRSRGLPDAGTPTANNTTTPDMGAPLDPTFDTVVTLLRENRCLSRGCHLNNTPSGSNQFAVMSSSDMPTREEIAAGLQGEGNDGPFVVASEPSESRLLDCLRAEGGCSLMPLGGPRLPDREIEAVADWIEQGASYDGE